MKPTLKAPGTKRLKLKYDNLLSSFAFKFNLRRYTKDAAQAASIVGCLGWRLEEAEVEALERAAKAVPASPGAPFEAW